MIFLLVVTIVKKNEEKTFENIVKKNNKSKNFEIKNRNSKNTLTNN